MRRTIKVCAALLLVWTMMSGAAFSVEASALSNITSDSIKEMEQQISDAKKEKENLQGSVSDLKKIKKELEAQKGNLKNYVTALDQNVSQMEQNITLLQQQITVKEADIQKTQEELAAAEETAESQYESMVIRIRFMYEANLLETIWKLFVTSDSFGDFLNMADYVNSVYEYDHQQLQEYRLNCEYISLCKEQLELEKEILNGQKTSVEQEQKRIEQLIAEKNQQITVYESDISNKEKAIAEYEKEIAEQNEIIAQLEKAVTDEKKQILASSGLAGFYDGSGFAMPLAYYTRISDDYGYRIHPTLHVKKFHNGVDFASPKGTAIYAAYDGVVVASAYNATMGNYVMIDHGEGLFTIYMHASKLIAKEDQIVLRGEKIAEVGTTGRSTGNHLHFGVRLNGAYVTPWDYIPDVR